MTELSEHLLCPHLFHSTPSCWQAGRHICTHTHTTCLAYTQGFVLHCANKHLVSHLHRKQQYCACMGRGLGGSDKEREKVALSLWPVCESSQLQRRLHSSAAARLWTEDQSPSVWLFVHSPVRLSCGTSKTPLTTFSPNLGKWCSSPLCASVFIITLIGELQIQVSWGDTVATGLVQRGLTSSRAALGSFQCECVELYVCEAGKVLFSRRTLGN